jgi:hypothetical protein
VFIECVLGVALTSSAMAIGGGETLQAGECQIEEKSQSRPEITPFGSIERDYEAARKKLDEDEPMGAKERAESEHRALIQITKEYAANDPQKKRALAADLLQRPDKGLVRRVTCDLISLFAESGDNRSLAAFLAKRCPDHVAIDLSIEALLVIVYDEQLADGVLVLCEAFDLADDQNVRANIATALRRGFKFAKIDAKDDKAFVCEVRRWYLQNRGKYVPNLDYFRQFENEFSYDREGLLISSEENERRLNLPKPLPPPLLRKPGSALKRCG